MVLIVFDEDGEGRHLDDTGDGESKRKKMETQMVMSNMVMLTLMSWMGMTMSRRRCFRVQASISSACLHPDL